MKASIKKNGVTFQVEAETFHDIIAQISVIQETAHCCGLCEGDLRFTYRKTKEKGYKYYGVICTECGAIKNLHLKENDSDYWANKKKDGTPDIFEKPNYNNS